MVISGWWQESDDGITRPMVTVNIIAADGSKVEQLFLIDSGADCTVFTLDLFSHLNFPASSNGQTTALHGVVGATSGVIVSTSLMLQTTEGVNVSIKGNFTALTDPTAIDTSILGRDVLANFNVILSRRRNEVLLVAGNHNYSITSS